MITGRSLRLEVESNPGSKRKTRVWGCVSVQAPTFARRTPMLGSVDLLLLSSGRYGVCTRLPPLCMVFLGGLSLVSCWRRFFVFMSVTHSSGRTRQKHAIHSIARPKSPTRGECPVPTVKPRGPHTHQSDQQATTATTCSIFHQALYPAHRFVHQKQGHLERGIRFLDSSREPMCQSNLRRIKQPASASGSRRQR